MPYHSTAAAIRQAKPAASSHKTGTGDAKRVSPFPKAGLPVRSQIFLGLLDHLADHLAADAAGLPGGQVAIIAFLQIDADFPWCVFTTKTRLILRSIHITVLDVF